MARWLVAGWLVARWLGAEVWVAGGWWLVAGGLVAGGWWLVAVVPNTRTHTQTHIHIDYRHKKLKREYLCDSRNFKGNPFISVMTNENKRFSFKIYFHL